MRLAYVGRFREGWATERDLANALRRAGHSVVELHEDDPATWLALASPVARRPYELVVWTTARLAPSLGVSAALDSMSGSLPIVGYHLDRWWGLRRQAEMQGSPFFNCDLLVTADGGHDDDWVASGVKHRWLPPAVDRIEAQLEGRFDRALAVDVAFVGSWRRYHPEWPHRRELVAHLRSWFGPRFGLFPNHLGPLRGQALADLYASSKIVVGDSCLAGAGRYWSDRIPETLGRGAFLLHPAVEGLREHFKIGEHLDTWKVHDWPGLLGQLSRWLDDPAGRAEVAHAGRVHVLERHTYDNRAVELIGLCKETGLV